MSHCLGESSNLPKDTLKILDCLNLDCVEIADEDAAMSVLIHGEFRCLERWMRLIRAKGMSRLTFSRFTSRSYASSLYSSMYDMLSSIFTFVSWSRIWVRRAKTSYTPHQTNQGHKKRAY